MRNDVVEKLFLEYYNDAFLYTLTLSKDVGVAEDIVASAFYRALETADDSVLNFKYWLLRVCRNTFYNHAKRIKRHTSLHDAIPDEREHAIEKLIRDEEYQALYRAIELLPTAQKEIITLFYFEDMSIADISKIIDKTPTNTKVILFRARESLKEILEV